MRRRRSAKASSGTSTEKGRAVGWLDMGSLSSLDDRRGAKPVMSLSSISWHIGLPVVSSTPAAGPEQLQPLQVIGGQLDPSEIARDDLGVSGSMGRSPPDHVPAAGTRHHP